MIKNVGSNWFFIDASSILYLTDIRLGLIQSAFKTTLDEVIKIKSW